MKGRRSYRRGLRERNVDQLDGSYSNSDDEVDFRSHENAQPLVLDEKVSELKANYPGHAKLFAVILINIMLLLGILQTTTWARNKSTVTNNLHFAEDLKIVGKKFNLSKHSLLKIKVGVNIIHTERSAGSFIILYNSGDNNFHRSQFNEMINDIANATAKYLRNGSGNFIELESNNLKVANHEQLLYKYSDALLESGVMLVKDLDNLPTNLAMAFHYFCDEYAPQVEKTAIFFTIDKQKCSINSNSQLHKWIERCLADKWWQMREDSISPLLARVVEIVVEF